MHPTVFEAEAGWLPPSPREIASPEGCRDRPTCVAERRRMAKPVYIEIPLYDGSSGNRKSVQTSKDVCSPRSAFVKDDAFGEEYHSLASSISSTCISSCWPSPPAGRNSFSIAAAAEEHAKNAPALRNTYFFDHRCGVGFISIPHLGNHVCATTLGIFRIIENWLEEKLFKYTGHGHDNEEFVPILEENVKSTAAGVSTKLEATPKIFTGLSSVVVHIRTGHVYTLEGGRDLVAKEEADEFFQQYPLFLDVSVRIRRCSASTTSPGSDRWTHRKSNASIIGAPAVTASGGQEASCLEVIAEGPEGGLCRPDELTARTDERQSTCLVVKVTSDIKRFDLGQQCELPEPAEPKPLEYCGTSPGCRVGDMSPASSRTVVAPPSCDGCGACRPPAASAGFRARRRARRCESLPGAADPAQISASDAPEQLLLAELAISQKRAAAGDDDLIFEIDSEGSPVFHRRGSAGSDAPRAVPSAETGGCGGGRRGPGRGTAEFRRRPSEDVPSAGWDAPHQCLPRSHEHHEHEGNSAYLDDTTMLSSRRTSAAPDAFAAESDAFGDLDDYYTATVVARVAW